MLTHTHAARAPHGDGDVHDRRHTRRRTSPSAVGAAQSRRASFDDPGLRHSPSGSPASRVGSWASLLPRCVTGPAGSSRRVRGVVAPHPRLRGRWEPEHSCRSSSTGSRRYRSCSTGRLQSVRSTTGQRGMARHEHVGVDADIAGKTEHTLAEDVAHDLGGAAFDGGGSRTEEPSARWWAWLELRASSGSPACGEAARAEQVERQLVDFLAQLRRRELADRSLPALACRRTTWPSPAGWSVAGVRRGSRDLRRRRGKPQR